jgi:hypothetical protein
LPSNWAGCAYNAGRAVDELFSEQSDIAYWLDESAKAEKALRDALDAQFAGLR